MTCRELIQNLKSNLEREFEFNDQQIEVNMIGNSREAKAKILIPIEGKIRVVEINAKDLGLFEMQKE